MCFKETEGQVARWLEMLQSYVFTRCIGLGLITLMLMPCPDAPVHLMDADTASGGRPMRESSGRKRRHASCIVGVGEWRTKQEQDVDLQSVLQWVEEEQRPPWDEVAGT